MRSFVTKRKISGGKMSRNGRVARNTMLGLMKTCRKLGLSFWQYLGDRIGLKGQAIQPLATLVATKARRAYHRRDLAHYRRRRRLALLRLVV